MVFVEAGVIKIWIAESCRSKSEVSKCVTYYDLQLVSLRPYDRAGDRLRTCKSAAGTTEIAGVAGAEAAELEPYPGDGADRSCCRVVAYCQRDGGRCR